MTRRAREILRITLTAVAMALLGAVVVFAHLSGSGPWEHSAVHSALESAGAAAELAFAAVLAMLYARRSLPSLPFVWAAAAAAVIGVLGGAHALTSTSAVSAWLQSTATLAGGVLFACVWLPGSVHRGRTAASAAAGVLLVAAALAAVALTWPEGLSSGLTRESTGGNSIRFLAVLNAGGAAGYVAAALFFVGAFSKQGRARRQRLLSRILAAQCFLFCLAAVLPVGTAPWASDGSTGTAVRFLAHGVAFAGVLLLFRRALGETRWLEDELALARKLRDAASEASRARCARDLLERDTLRQLARERTAALNMLADADEGRRRAIATAVAVRDRAAALERRNRELDDLTYLAALDLQEPLRRLIAFSELLARDAGSGLPERARADLRHLESTAHHMHTTLRDLLELSRSQNRAFAPVKLRLALCADRALDELAERIERVGATVSRDPLPEVHGDSALLSQLYVRLLANALTFVADDHVPEIRLTAQRRATGWVFGVQDNGIGIAPRDSETIFAPFRRLHGRDVYAGSGVGLAICHSVVERHGGRIWVESKLGRGAHFRFTLERQDEAPSRPDQRAAVRSAPPSARESSPPERLRHPAVLDARAALPDAVSRS